MTYGHKRVTGSALGVGGGVDGVHQQKGAYNLGSQAVSESVAMGHRVGPSTLRLVEVGLESLDYACSADGTQALTNDVINRAVN